MIDHLPEHVTALLQRRQTRAAAVADRENRYRGDVTLRYAADEVRGDLKNFNVNLCRLAVDAVAERMRVDEITAYVGASNYGKTASEIWQYSNLDQHLQAILVDALALGSAYLIVWPDATGRPRITPESATQVATEHDPITGAVTGAVKAWTTYAPAGDIQSEHVVYYGPERITHYRRARGGWEAVGEPVPNPMGVVPVIPLINAARLGDDHGSSVIDDMGHLVDALSKVLADMLVASEDVARPRRWASGVDLEEDNALDDGFSADGPEVDALADVTERSTVSPFESGNRMFTVESPDAKFGQLPGADLAGYRTAVDLLTQQIMAVSALPAHMVGITSANPSSADAIRAAEASLTARAESRIKVLALPLERALALAVAMELGRRPHDVDVTLGWASPATRSEAQEADATTKLHSLSIIDTEEARRRMGIGDL